MFPLTLLTTLIAPVMFHGGVFVTERKRQVMRGTNCSAEKQIPPTAARERRDTRTVLARTAWDSRKTQKASIHSPGLTLFFQPGTGFGGSVTCGRIQVPKSVSARQG